MTLGAVFHLGDLHHCGRSFLGSFTAGSIAIINDLDNSEMENSSAHYQPLADTIEVLKANEPTVALSAQTSTSSDNSYTSNRAQNLSLLNQAILTSNVTGLEAALSTLIYASLRSAVKLQELSRSFPPYDHDSWFMILILSSQPP